MKISAAKFKFTEKDILNLLKDYIHLDEINIEEVLIGEIIKIKGKYVKKLNIPFEVEIGIGSVKNNYLNIKIYKIKVMKLALIRLIKDAITKNITNDLLNYGVSVNKDIIRINLKNIIKLIPHLKLNVIKINTINDVLEVEVENIIYQKDDGNYIK